MEEFVYEDLAPVQIPVRYKQDRFVLREATPGGGAAYKNALARTARFDQGRNFVGVDNVAETELLLVSHCLYLADSNGDLKLTPQGHPINVPLGVIKSWNFPFVEQLAKRAKEISGLAREDTEAETEESLERKIAELQKQLDGMREARGSDPSKNGHAATTVSSA